MNGRFNSPFQKKNRSRSILGDFSTPSATNVERSHADVEQFLAMLRFEQRDKLAELPGDLLETGRDDFIKYPLHFTTITYRQSHKAAFNSAGRC